MAYSSTGTGFDLLVVGAGPVGCVVAERAATVLGWKVLVIEKRGHVAGNCHDITHSSGVLIHKYGPHYFRASDPKIVDYLSRFTDWIPGNYIVKSNVGGTLYPFPINLTTLELFTGRKLTPESAEALLREWAIPCANPRNSEEFVLSRVGRKMYETFYEGYTTKQWGISAANLAPSVCGRIPIRFNRDERYVNEPFQMMPKAGFTELFTKMLTHPLIEVRLNTDVAAVRGSLSPRLATLWTGPLDVYFDNVFGPLPWRSLAFEFKAFEKPFVQPCVQINYPSIDVPYTRTVEIKHVTQQKTDRTVVSYEYPRGEGEPYYPIPSDKSAEQFQRYRGLAEREQAERNVFFAGRLANYTYINTDQAIEMGLTTFKKIQDRFAAPGGARIINLSSKNEKDRLVVVMPVYNEAGNLKRLLDEWIPVLREHVGRFEFLAINDGSKDDSLAVLHELAKRIPELEVVDQKNSGHGQACLRAYGIALERGADWVFQIDSDGQCIARNFPEFWKKRNAGRPLYGVRFKREDGLFRTVVSKFLSLLVLAVVRTWVRDSNVPFRLISRECLSTVIPRIPNTFYLANVGLSVLHKRHFGIAWLPIGFRDRWNGTLVKPPASFFLRQARKLLKDLQTLDLSPLPLLAEKAPPAIEVVTRKDGTVKP